MIVRPHRVAAPEPRRVRPRRCGVEDQDPACDTGVCVAVPRRRRRRGAGDGEFARSRRVRGDGVTVPLDAVDAAPSNTKIQGRRYARGHAGPSPEKPGEARHDAAERGPLPDGRQRRGDAAFELFHLFCGEDDARLLVLSFHELRGWEELAGDGAQPDFRDGRRGRPGAALERCRRAADEEACGS